MDRVMNKLLAVGLMVGLAGTAGASIILNPDGDFAAEINNAVVGADWAPHDAFAIGKTASQSPFTNLFANNAMGVTVGNAGYMVGWTPSLVTTGVLYFNVDFRYDVQDTPNPNAVFGFAITKDAAASNRSLCIAITKDGVYADSNGVKGASLLAPVMDTWYNVQLTLDVSAGTYTGTITPYGGSSVAITTRNFYSNSGINSIFTNNSPDDVGDRGRPSYSVDNFALAIPEPASLALLGLGGLALLRRRRR